MAIIYRGRVGGNYQYWNEDQTPPFGATNITVVNVPALTASHVDRSVYAPDGIYCYYATVDKNWNPAYW